MATVVTADVGGVDRLPYIPAVQDIDVAWHYYTDTDRVAPCPWQTIPVTPDYAGQPNLSAKVYKMTPPEADTDVVWIDANMQITSPGFVREALGYRHDGVALFAHPRRDCVYAEADASLGAESQGGKYEPWREAIDAQMRAYLAEGYPAHRGLWAAGVLAWDLDTAAGVRLGDAWLRECARWSPQDQLSFPVVCWRLGLHPGTFDFEQFVRPPRGQSFLANHWLRIYGHRSPARA